MRIRYTIVSSSMGRLLIAATERGLCAAGIGMPDSALEADLFSEYDDAEIQKENLGLDNYISSLLECIEGKGSDLNLHLDIKVTYFRSKVYEMLRKIPCGHLCTYGEIAAAIGQPKTFRAVARACATNPVALAIPCHRVIRKDGSLSGYRWGIRRKCRLIFNEKRDLLQESQV